MMMRIFSVIGFFGWIAVLVYYAMGHELPKVTIITALILVILEFLVRAIKLDD